MPQFNSPAARLAAIKAARAAVNALDRDDMTPAQRRQADRALGASSVVVSNLGRKVEAERRAAPRIATVSYRDAFSALLTRPSGLSAEEHRALDRARESRDVDTGTGGAGGGYLVPQEWAGPLMQNLKFASAVVSTARIVETKGGGLLSIPLTDDRAFSGVVQPEGQSVPQGDPTLTHIQLGGFTFAAQFNVSTALAQDSGQDVGELFGELAGYRIGRQLSAYTWAGTGTAQPLGLGTGITPDITEPTGNTTGVTFASLNKLAASLDSAYRRRAAWYMSDATLTLVANLVDASGRPIWPQSDVSPLGNDPQLLGMPVCIVNDMPALQASTISVMVADLSAGYVMHHVGQPTVNVYREARADRNEVLVSVVDRWDSAPAIRSARRYLQTSAT